MNISLVREAGDVERWHAKRTLRSQNLAHHHWNVMMLLLHVWPTASRSAMLYAATHDLPELLHGDVPAQAKRDAPELKQIMDKLEDRAFRCFEVPSFNVLPNEQRLVDLCDSAECFLWATEEVSMGNRNMRHVADRALRHFEAKDWPTDPLMREQITALHKFMLQVQHESNITSFRPSTTAEEQFHGESK